MRIAVIGAGGVGGYFGAQLAGHGHDVVFVARGRHLEAIRERGLIVRSDRAPVHLDSPKTVERIDEVGGADLVVVAVKLWDTDDVARQLAPLAAGGAAILSLQNGVVKDDVLREHVGPGSVLGGVCYISAAIEEPGVVVHHGSLARILFGEYDGSATPRTQEILRALTESGIEAEVSPDISRALWEKYVFLVGLSSVTAATRQPIGVLRDLPGTRALLHQVMAEVVAVGRARGVDLAADFATDRLEFCDTLPSGFSSSMAYDLSVGNRLELPWLGGGVVAMAEEVGVDVPGNRALAAVLEPYVAGARG